MNEQNLPFGNPNVVKWFYSSEYEKSEEEDYGILILNTPVGEMTGYFGIAAIQKEELKSKDINVTGYPGDKVEGKPKTYEMWGMKGKASHIDDDYISYMIDTYGGQSGSGVWYQEGDECFVAGVHVLGGHINKATLLTPARYQQIQKWIHEYMKQDIDALIQVSVERFDLSQKTIGDYGAKHLVSYPLEKLQHLNLSSNNIGDEGAIALASNTSWTRLQWVDLGRNQIGDEGAIALASDPKLKQLQALYLGWNQIGDEGIKALASNQICRCFKFLNLLSRSIGYKDISKNSFQQIQTQLQGFDLESSQIGDMSAKIIVFQKILTQIQNHKLPIDPANLIGGEIFIPQIANGYEEIYRRFINGKLIYRPDPSSDDGKIELLFKDLRPNPLEGTFDLSSFGDNQTRIKISTGYRERKIPANQSKVEIWISPRFFIERMQDRNQAHQFQGIMHKWTAPVGVFWTWGNWDDLNGYDYLVESSFEELGLRNLQEHGLSSPIKHSFGRAVNKVLHGKSFSNAEIDILRLITLQF